MARYRYPYEVNWSAGIQEAPKYINEVTFGVAINLVLLTIAVIVGSGYWFTKRDIIGSLAVGSFCAWVIAFLFWLIDIVGGFNFVFITAVMILFVSLLWIERD